MNTNNSFDKYLEIINNTSSTLDDLTYELYRECETRVSECKSALIRIASELSAVDNYETNIDYYYDLLRDKMENQIELECLEAKIFVIRELEIIYKYKNIEIALKHIISLSYPNEDTHELYNWGKLKSFTKSKGASITQAKCYQEINDLRRVSNALKHSGKITNDVRAANIKEFKGLEVFCNCSLGDFYKRVEPSVIEFYISFCGLLLTSIGGSEFEWLELFKPYINPDPNIPF